MEFDRGISRPNSFSGCLFESFHHIIQHNNILFFHLAVYLIPGASQLSQFVIQHVWTFVVLLQFLGGARAAKWVPPRGVNAS